MYIVRSERLKKRIKKMKNFISILFVAILGGLIALGLFKLYDKKQTQSFEELQKARFASNTVPITGGSPVDFVAASQLVTPMVVHIKTEFAPRESGGGQIDPFDFFNGRGFEMPPQGPSAGSGSGVIISADGYIVTNNHVIDNANNIEVVLNDNRSYPAELIGHDPNTDLALIKIEESGLPFIQFGNSDDVKIGQWVLAVGNPFNLTSTVTAGIVSAKGRGLNLLGTQYAIESFIQTDAAVNPGNSGGALVDTEGKLIGINSAIATQTGSYSGYSFAIPINIVRKVMEDLLKYGNVQRGFLGVSIKNVDSKLATEMNLGSIKGVYVADLNENSAAGDAGIKKGDVIIRVNEIPVNSVPALQEQISKYHPGDKVNVTVLRDNKEKTCNVVLKSKEGSTSITTVDRKAPSTILDAQLENLSMDEKRKLKVNHGVRIKKLKDGVLKGAGIKEGFVITSIDKKPIYNVTDAQKALENKKGGVLVEGINPDGTKGYYAIGLE
jgi:serine protease Do